MTEISQDLPATQRTVVQVRRQTNRQLSSSIEAPPTV